MKKVKVICCNDSIEGADEVAIIDRLSKEHYEKNKFQFDNSTAEYRQICYWHIHEIPILNK